ncbi:MAG: DUF692 domain-containing protein [Rhodospirillum sp.]|nr:DUF692 domain-containing protein [Rhodospirillum sp.]MCF8488692.1 DUF692 domain-containing protein [Rhodospirillum sp.]MCF8501554.1 DUF692 domain-containing protein [Rhodospirillum sp.]
MTHHSAKSKAAPRTTRQATDHAARSVPRGIPRVPSFFGKGKGKGKGKGALPRAPGIGLKALHQADLLEAPPASVHWVEAHTENFMARGGPTHRWLDAIRDRFPLSLHGVALSLGAAHGVDPDHLARVKAVVDRFDPVQVSEHLAWVGPPGIYLNDLLPLPLTEDSLAVVADNVSRVQGTLGRSILVENPSQYLAFHDTVLAEPDFLAELARRTGCGLLLDVNNVHVSAVNLGFDAIGWLDRLAAQGPPVGEIHLAGHADREVEGVTILIDDHGSRVRPAVWDLYDHALSLFGPTPTLIEWDSDVPPLSVLADEAAQAGARLAAHGEREMADA